MPPVYFARKLAIFNLLPLQNLTKEGRNQNTDFNSQCIYLQCRVSAHTEKKILLFIPPSFWWVLHYKQGIEHPSRQHKATPSFTCFSCSLHIPLTFSWAEAIKDEVKTSLKQPLANELPCIYALPVTAHCGHW